MCLRERGHSGKVGLGLELAPVPSDHRLALSGWREECSAGPGVAGDRLMVLASLWSQRVRGARASSFLFWV